MRAAYCEAKNAPAVGDLVKVEDSGQLGLIILSDPHEGKQRVRISDWTLIDTEVEHVISRQAFKVCISGEVSEIPEKWVVAESYPTTFLGRAAAVHVDVKRYTSAKITFSFTVGMDEAENKHVGRATWELVFKETIKPLVLIPEHVVVLPSRNRRRVVRRRPLAKGTKD